MGTCLLTCIQPKGTDLIPFSNLAIDIEGLEERTGQREWTGYQQLQMAASSFLTRAEFLDHVVALAFFPRSWMSVLGALVSA